MVMRLTPVVLLGGLVLSACGAGEAPRDSPLVVQEDCQGVSHNLERDYFGVDSNTAVRAEAPGLLDVAPDRLTYEQVADRSPTDNRIKYTARDGRRLVATLIVVDRPGRSGVERYTVCGGGGGGLNTVAPRVQADAAIDRALDAAPAPPAMTNFHIGFNAWTPDQADAIKAEIAACVQAAGGIQGGIGLHSLPPQEVIDYAGPQADELEACLSDVGGEPEVTRTNW